MTTSKKEKQAEPQETMVLWDQVCKTDPDITKPVKQKGGFTAIDAQHQIKMATSLWGPYGGEWGVKDCQYGNVGTVSDDGQVFPCEVTLEAVFFYPGAEFEISTDIKFRVGGDSRKKLLTDLTTKALSKLGFNSDVFEGRFDDSKYVSEMREEFAKPTKLVDYSVVEAVDSVISKLRANDAGLVVKWLPPGITRGDATANVAELVGQVAAGDEFKFIDRVVAKEIDELYLATKKRMETQQPDVDGVVIDAGLKNTIPEETNSAGEPSRFALSFADLRISFGEADREKDWPAAVGRAMTAHELDDINAATQTQKKEIIACLSATLKA